MTVSVLSVRKLLIFIVLDFLYISNFYTIIHHSKEICQTPSESKIEGRKEGLSPCGLFR